MASDDGFFSRWSRRKADVREGRLLDDPKPTAVGVEGRNSRDQTSKLPKSPDAAAPTSAQPPSATPVPTLADVQQLTPDSDFTGFMARGIAPDVKNAALKKLFSDPHFNVMDRMDIYIDDYSQPDPLPLAMLRQMTSAKTLNLFDDEPQKTADTNAGDNPAATHPKVVAQSAPTENNSNTEPSPNDHADLRLQPDPAPRPEGAEPEPV